MIFPKIPPIAKTLWEMFPLMVDVLPPGKKGDVVIKHFLVTPERAMVESARRNELWTAGRFVQFNIGGVGWMYDILHERAMNYRAVCDAKGDILIAGLGIGMILWPILKKRTVRTVTVLENNPAVIDLVLPSLERAVGREKLRIVEEDAKTFSPPAESFDSIWLDCVPAYGYSDAMFDLQDQWMIRYRPFLRERGNIGHWGFEENLQWRLDLAYKKEEPRLRGVPIGPPDPMVTALIESHNKKKGKAQTSYQIDPAWAVR